jgi:hypothetical protein
MCTQVRAPLNNGFSVAHQLYMLHIIWYFYGAPTLHAPQKFDGPWPIIELINSEYLCNAWS